MAFDIFSLLSGAGALKSAMPARREGGLSIPAGTTPFRKDLRAADFGSTNETNLKNTKFNNIGSYTVGAQSFVRLGYGSASLPDNQGYYYILIHNAADAAQSGMIRILARDAQDVISKVLMENRTERLAGSTTDKQEQVPQPEIDPLIKEDSSLDIDFKPDTNNVDYSPTTSTLLVPITQYL